MIYPPRLDVHGNSGAMPARGVYSMTPLACLLLAAACGSDVSGGSDNPKPDQARTGTAPSSETAGNLAPSSTTSTTGSPDAPARPTSIADASAGGPPTTPAPSVNESCGALAADACAACLCEVCRQVLDACAGTPGCPEILACVQESACSGSDCFCGDASLPACVAGRANGPCKEAVLAAPAGRQPTLTNPSGGPASDAALGVAQCAEDDVRCREACGFAD
jgi:hypothetical protein